jgi:hypothetical protein
LAIERITADGDRAVAVVRAGAIGVPEPVILGGHLSMKQSSCVKEYSALRCGSLRRMVPVTTSA